MFAVIDVGSNSVRLMLHDGEKTLSKEVNTTQLAEGLSKTNMLKPEAVERTARAVSFFVEKAKSFGVENPLIFATAGVRQAKNGTDFTKRVKEFCGITVDVISGETEAYLGLLGALDNGDGGVIDIGGASTEIVVSQNSKVDYCKSIDIGAVRLKDLCGQDKQFTTITAAEKICDFGTIPDTKYYAIGGTATTIAAMMQELDPYDPKKTDGFKIEIDKLQNLKDKLFCLSVEQRKKIKGLQEKRAEIIAHGVTLLFTIMEKHKLPYVTVSEKDNLEGYLKLNKEKI